MSFQIKKRMCFIMLIVLILLIFLPWSLRKKTQPEGIFMGKEDFQSYHRLINHLTESEETIKGAEAIQAAKTLVDTWPQKWVSYGQWKEWFQIMEEGFDLLEPSEEERLEEKYSNSLLMVKEDMDLFLEKLWRVLDVKEEIVYQQLILLGDSSRVTDLEGKSIEENMIFTDNGKWIWEAGNREVPFGKQVKCLTYRGGIWDYKEVNAQPLLENSLVVESSEEVLTLFYNNYYITYEAFGILEKGREQIADVVFKDQQPSELLFKGEKLTGKVVKLSEKELELSEQGTYPLAENIQYYQLYGQLKNIGRNEIPLGYAFTDFIVEDGKIQAALLVKDEKMESLRVLLKTQQFQGYFHETVSFHSDVDVEIIFGGNRKLIPAGEKVEITPESQWFENNRIYILPKALTGRTFFPELNRNNNGQGYFGAFEIEKRKEGFVLINEVLLEEYLYAVVPSEMPGYYPMEALKAQAISARTYAYQRMKSPGLSEYGANLDDSSTYQVYNNISENTNTTRAVRETKGKLLYEGTNLADTYYYSTSCGYGTDASIWNSQGENPHSYLKAKEMTTGKAKEAGALREEEAFEDFITTTWQEHFESNEAWYRWSYEHKNMGVIKEKLEKRLQEYPMYVTFHPKTQGSTFQADKVQILTIEIKERKEGGTINCLLFHTDQGVVEVKNEYHVRAVLADGEALVNLQNGNTYACNNLLPSSFFVLDQEIGEYGVTGIKILGGGFGHGVGMSQNGAKNLANMGYSAEDILIFYYQDCQIRE